MWDVPIGSLGCAYWISWQFSPTPSGGGADVAYDVFISHFIYVYMRVRM